MTRMYTAEVVADSVSPDGHRITSVKVIYPHAVHKDMLRHRAHNRNVESFRAQPPEKLIEHLRSGGAFRPDQFSKRTKGMGQSHEEVTDAVAARNLWDLHVHQTLGHAEAFLELGIAKQQVNFLLQDLCPLTEIITATDWSNFYSLRTEVKEDGTPVARPEVYKTALAIKEAIEASKPYLRDYDELHLPLLMDEELERIRYMKKELGYPDGFYEVEGYWVRVSAGRCARISFGDFDWRSELPAVSLGRAEKLMQAGHMSPFEQQAKPFSEKRWQFAAQIQGLAASYAEVGWITDREAADMARQAEYSGNLHGWVPARKMFKNEHDYGLLRAPAEA